MDDVLNAISGITSRAMFGGYGIYKDGNFFALIADSTLYFKVDEINIEDYKELDSYPFEYKRPNNKVSVMSYWAVPDEILYDKDDILDWVNKAVSVSKRAKNKNKK